MRPHRNKEKKGTHDVGEEAQSTTLATVFPISDEVKASLEKAQPEKKVSFWSRLFRRSPKGDKTEPIDGKEKLGELLEDNDSLKGRGFGFPEDHNPPRNNSTSQNEAENEKLEKVEGKVYSFRLWEQRINLKKDLLRNNFKFCLPFLTTRGVVNVYCDPWLRFQPTQEEVEDKLREIILDSGGMHSQRINVIANDLSQAKSQLADKLYERKEEPFANLVDLGVVDELDKLDEMGKIGNLSPDELISRKQKVINNHLRQRKEFSWDIKVIDTVSALKEEIEIYLLYLLYLPERSSTSNLLNSFIAIIEDENYQSLVMLFYEAELFYENACSLRDSLRRDLRTLSCSYSLVGKKKNKIDDKKKITLEELKQFLEKLIESLDALLSVLYKYYLIRESAYQEIPSGFVEITAGQGLYKDEFGTLFCCEPGNSNKVLGKCCLNFLGLEPDPGCFQHYENIFRNFRPSR